MDFTNKNVLVVGSGISGISATRLLIKKNARVTIYDGNSSVNTDNITKEINNDIDFIIGDFPLVRLDEFELMVLSPGVPTDLEFINMAREKGMPIWSEIELAYKCSKGRIIAITGTNGKTTTTALVGEIMKNYFDSVFVVGNIGIPYTSIVLDTQEHSVVVAEISSFQLETIIDFKPLVSSILNITPDHLNRHKTIENYIKTKIRITENQDSEGICILNYDDIITREIAYSIPTKSIYFSRLEKLEEGVYLENNNIVYSKDKLKLVVCSINELKLLGDHNIENVMSAVAMSISIGVPVDRIREIITKFAGVEHRIEYVASINGVTYYNDSKATNPDSAIKAIQAMVRPTILIGGGMDKGSTFDEWILSFDDKVKYLILFGETKNIISDTAKKYNFNNIIIVNDLKEAVLQSKKLAEKGDCVLLSPACASWDMFKSYEERGKLFKDYIVSLGE